MQPAGNLCADWYGHYWSRKNRIRESIQVNREIYGAQIYSLYKGYLESLSFMVFSSSSSLYACLLSLRDYLQPTPHNLALNYKQPLFSNYLCRRERPPRWCARSGFPSAKTRDKCTVMFTKHFPKQTVFFHIDLCPWNITILRNHDYLHLTEDEMDSNFKPRFSNTNSPFLN